MISSCLSTLLSGHWIKKSYVGFSNQRGNTRHGKQGLPPSPPLLAPILSSPDQFTFSLLSPCPNKPHHWLEVVTTGHFPRMTLWHWGPAPTGAGSLPTLPPPQVPWMCFKAHSQHLEPAVHAYCQHSGSKSFIQPNFQKDLDKSGGDSEQR